MRLLVALCGILVALSACTSVEEQLRPELEIPDLAPLSKSAKRHAAGSTTVQSGATPDAPVGIAVHRYGKKRDNRVIFAIHGILSDHDAWRFLIGELAPQFEVWAVDLPGCGDSDKPEPMELSDDAYSATWLAWHMMSVLRQELAGRDPDLRVTLLGHSLGGGVVLRMLGSPEIRKEYGEVLDRIDGAVLLAPLDFELRETKKEFVTLAQLKDVEVTIGTIAGIVEKEAAVAVLGSSIDPDRIPLEEFTRMYEILRDLPRRHAMQYMLRRAIPRKQDGQRDAKRVESLVADYQRIEQPCLLLWGELDDTLPFYSGVNLKRDLPKARLQPIGDCKHSVQIEDPWSCARAVRQFLDSGLADFEDYSEPLTRFPSSPPADESGDAFKAAQDESVSRGLEGPVTSAPSTVSVLQGWDMERSGVRYLSDALRIMPGVEVQRLSSTESGVAFRGFLDTSTASQGTLGLVDGRQVYNLFLGNVLWDQLAVRLEDVKKVEVVRGPGSFIHGPNAMHGVVNIETKSPLDYEPNTYSVSTIAHAGSYDSVVLGATMVNRGRNSGTRISAQWDDIGQFDNDRGDTRNKGFVNAALAVQLDGDRNKVLGLSAGFVQQEFDLLLPRVEVIPSTVPSNDARELYVRTDYRFGDPEELSVDTHFSWTGFDADFMPEEFYAPFTLDLDTLSLGGQVTWKSGAHDVIGGLGYRRSTFDTDDTDAANGRHSVDEGWIFLQDQLRASEALWLTLGLRVDQHSETGTHLSPRAAAVWEFVKNHHVRASAGRGFRNPSLRELWFDMPVDVPGLPTITIMGNAGLSAESLTSFELGYLGTWGSGPGEDGDTDPDRDPAPGGHRIEAGASVFYNLIDNLIGFDSDPTDPTIVLPVNQSDEEAYGIELEGRYQLDNRFTALLNYSLAERRDRETGEKSFLAPLQNLNAGVTYSSPHGLHLMLWVNFQDSTELDGEPIDSYVLLNGSIYYRFPVTLSAEGRAFIRFFNLLDDDHREHPQGDSYGMILTGGLRFDW